MPETMSDLLGIYLIQKKHGKLVHMDNVTAHDFIALQAQRQGEFRKATLGWSLEVLPAD